MPMKSIYLNPTDHKIKLNSCCLLIRSGIAEEEVYQNFDSDMEMLDFSVPFRVY